MLDLSNVAQHSGGLVAISGCIMVLFGLFLIFLAVMAMNKITSEKEGSEAELMAVDAPQADDDISDSSDIPDDHIAVVFTSVELYRRLHFDFPLVVTSIRESDSKLWKMGRLITHRT